MNHREKAIFFWARTVVARPACHLTKVPSFTDENTVFCVRLASSRTQVFPGLSLLSAIKPRMQMRINICRINSNGLVNDFAYNHRRAYWWIGGPENKPPPPHSTSHSLVPQKETVPGPNARPKLKIKMNVRNTYSTRDEYPGKE